MENCSRVEFSIQFEGSSECAKDTNVCAIDVHGLKTKIFASSFQQGNSNVVEGRLKWSVPQKNSIHFLNRKRSVSKISLTLEGANSFTLSARVFQCYNNYSVLEQKLDGSIQPQRCARRNDTAITIDHRPEFKAGDRYIIIIINTGNGSLRASFVKKEDQKVKKDGSFGASSSAQSKTQEKSLAKNSEEVNKQWDFEDLTENQIELYNVLMNSTTMAILPWIRKFISEMDLSPQEKELLIHSTDKYSSVAKQELIRQIKSKEPNMLSALVGIHRSNKHGKPVLLRQLALGELGYTSFMIEVLKSVAGKNFEKCEPTINRLAAEFATNALKSV